MSQPGSTAGGPVKSFDQAIVDVHGTYRSHQGAYSPPDERVGDTISWPLLRTHVVRSGILFLVASIIAVIAMYFTFLGAMIGQLSSLNGEAEGNGSSAFGAFMTIVAFLAYIACIVTLFIPVNEPIAEYSLLLEGRVAAGPASYWWILHTAQGRQTPYRMEPARLAGQYFLSIKDGRDQAMVVVRTVGQDLFVGWTMWRRRSTASVIGQLLRDLFHLTGRGTVYHAALRNSGGRALREFVQSLTREGIQAAISNFQPPDGVLERDLATLPDAEMMLMQRNDAGAPAGGLSQVGLSQPSGPPANSADHQFTQPLVYPPPVAPAAQPTTYGYVPDQGYQGQADSYPVQQPAYPPQGGRHGEN